MADKMAKYRTEIQQVNRRESSLQYSFSFFSLHRERTQRGSTYRGGPQEAFASYKILQLSGEGMGLLLCIYALDLHHPPSPTTSGVTLQLSKNSISDIHFHNLSIIEFSVQPHRHNVSQFLLLLWRPRTVSPISPTPISKARKFRTN